MTWAERVYDADKLSASLCTRMSQNGFLYDSKRASAMSAELRGLEEAAERKAWLVAGRQVKGVGTGGKDLAKLFFQELKAPVFMRSALTHAPSLGVDVLRAYAAGGREDLRELSKAILECRRARKLRSTYIDNVQPGASGRVHPSWLSYGAVSGRFACQGPNLMNLPRAENDPTKEFFEGGIRSLYLAPPGSLIFGFDCSQLEMRICAYASGDPVMIASCESSDMHSANAAALFGEAFTSLTLYATDEHGEAIRDRDGKPKAYPERSMFRTLAKTSGFAAAYLAEAETVHARLLASGVQVKMRMVEAMLRRLKRNCAGYYAWQDQRLLDAVRLGWTDEPVLGRRRWVGHDPSPTETANFPIQGGAAGHMNTRLPVLEQVLRSECQALCVAQVHDAAYFEIKESHLELAQRLTVDIFQEPQSFGARKASLSVDMGASERWH